MLEVFDAYGRAYNELILSSTYWNDHLPHSIEAFYFHCGGAREAEAHLTRAAFLLAYNVTEAWRFPVVCIDVTNWQQPFLLVHRHG